MTHRTPLYAPTRKMTKEITPPFKRQNKTNKQTKLSTNSLVLTNVRKIANIYSFKTTDL